MHTKRLKNQKGVAFVEYAIAVAALIGAFAVIGVLLQLVAIRVAKRTVESVQEDVPCIRDPERTDEVFDESQCM